jgi:putative Mg2+ transporter-C (MgtC) family protein
MLLATLLGVLLGWERGSRRKPAGLRTLALVSLSAALFVLAGSEAARRAGEPIEAMRGMAGIAGGVGFLGAGLIVQTRGEVRWLTTAASLWAAAAVGLAAGLGLYTTAIVGGLLVYAILRWLVYVEDRWVQKPEGESDSRSRGKHGDKCKGGEQSVWPSDGGADHDPS